MARINAHLARGLHSGVCARERQRGKVVERRDERHDNEGVRHVKAHARVIEAHEARDVHASKHAEGVARGCRERGAAANLALKGQDLQHADVTALAHLEELDVARLAASQM